MSEHIPGFLDRLIRERDEARAALATAKAENEALRVVVDAARGEVEQWRDKALDADAWMQSATRAEAALATSRRRADGAEAAAAALRGVLVRCANMPPGDVCGCAGCDAARALAETETGAALLADLERLRRDAEDHAAEHARAAWFCDSLRDKLAEAQARVQALTAALTDLLANIHIRDGGHALQGAFGRAREALESPPPPAAPDKAATVELRPAVRCACCGIGDDPCNCVCHYIPAPAAAWRGRTRRRWR